MLLLVWLFAVASGMADACVLKAHGDHAHVATSETLRAAYAYNAPAGHTSYDTNHDGDEVDISMAPCLKVCDDGSQALLKLNPFVDLADRGAALTDSMLSAAALKVASAHQHLNSSLSATSEPPVRVRYSRLAL